MLLLGLLNLSQNRFWGTLPSPLGLQNHSNSLQIFDVSQNVGLDGLFPDISLLSNMEVLHIGRTAMIGNLPYDLSRLTRLKSLKLYAMDAVTGMIPDIDTLTSLTTLLIVLNGIQGQFFPNLRKLSSLGKKSK
jgi:hypothetical protein